MSGDEIDGYIFVYGIAAAIMLWVIFKSEHDEFKFWQKKKKEIYDAILKKFKRKNHV
jgi:hypothetical protein